MRLFRCARWLMLAFLLSLIPASSHAQISISVGFAPPMLPVYEQPPCPEPNLIWVPGYWAYGYNDYYWVPGAWVEAPYEGALWTPNYWGWYGGRYRFHRGYWGRHVGYYGGVNYGYGYEGIGFSGGEWRGNQFAYNTAVMRVNQDRIRTVYVDRTIVERNTVARDNHVSYSGGPGGIRHTAAPQEQIAARERHVAPTRSQTQHVQAAQADRSSFAKANGGHPARAAVERPLSVGNNAAGAGARQSPQQTRGTAPLQNNGARGNATNARGAGVNRGTSHSSRTATPAQQTPNASQVHRPVITAPQTPARTGNSGATQRGSGSKPEARATPQPNRTQPSPQVRTTPQQQSRPAPQQQARPAPQQQVRPAPQQHAPPAPQQQARPAPQQQARPAPQQQARPAPQQQARPAPQQQARPAPQQQARPAPQQQARPAPQQQARPAPQQHSAPSPKAEKPR